MKIDPIDGCKYYLWIIIIIIAGSFITGNIFKTERGIIYNLIFLSACFYFGRSLDENFPKFVLLLVVIIMNVFIAIIELNGVKTYLLPIGSIYGTLLIFTGIIFFSSKKTIKKR